jgi:hypothetical protein
LLAVLQLSRHALIAGYVARVQESETDRLRTLCDPNSRNAYRLLAQDIGQYLLEFGVTPLLDPAIFAAPIPRAADSPSLPALYVETLLYRTANPGSLVRRAYHRLWGKWRRFRTLRDCDEAFLVVFCRRGRLVELPIELNHDGLTIYAASIDLSETAAQPDRAATISFSAAGWGNDATKRRP